MVHLLGVPVQTRVQNSERRPLYSEERVDKRLEQYDSDLLDKTRFPQPSEK